MIALLCIWVWSLLILLTEAVLGCMIFANVADYISPTWQQIIQQLIGFYWYATFQQVQIKSCTTD